MSLKEILFNIIIPLISGIIGGTISANIIIQKNVRKTIMNNKDVKVEHGDIVNGSKNK
ncbi:MAG: hypothetical protein HFJ49_00630 [Clostridia bacterium]|nr:hypothetical protein [Clostridia bacterium]